LDHFDAVDRKHHSSIQRVIDEQLCHTPETATRNRKPLEEPAPFGASWELRCGLNNRFRVFYNVDAATLTVHILAVGVKERARLIIGGQEFEQ
jgi:mRNA-degrading endonuclease RelE of RelBE toxin-antitoxin system